MHQELKQLNVSIGRYFEGYTTIEIDLVKGQSTFSQWGGSAPKKVASQTLSEEVMANFLESLAQTDFLNWDKTYLNSESYEGTRWSVEIITNENRTKKYGENKFPKEWNLFCDLIEELALNNEENSLV
ncbi:MAG TPA: hypothetical protein DCY20_09525 [Firmicutes bacterium]|nr:hypothetical protein [Bacillota bacterium]